MRAETNNDILIARTREEGASTQGEALPALFTHHQTLNDFDTFLEWRCCIP